MNFIICRYIILKNLGSTVSEGWALGGLKSDVGHVTYQ
jgi:hypothetical protein